MSDTPKSLGRDPIFGVAVEEAAAVSRHLASLMKTGRCSIGLAIELAFHASKRYYDIHFIYREISILEGTSKFQSTTKPATPFRRDPLIGYHHKHHYQDVHLCKNMLLAAKKDNQIGKIVQKFVGNNIEDIINQLVHDATIGIISERSRSGEMTGELFVFEKLDDGSNYYIALGSHGEDHITKAKIDLFKIIDKEYYKIKTKND